jgi:hypothetical protein
MRTSLIFDSEAGHNGVLAGPALIERCARYFRE